MPAQDVDAHVVAAAARLAGIPLPDSDLGLLTQTMRRYAEVVAPLEAADLEGVEPASALDPRAGW